jgi:hypothetical protein
MVYPRHTIPDVENAANSYEASWNRFELDTVWRKFYDVQGRFPADQPGDTSSDGEALTLLNNCPDLIPSLMKACSKKLCRFPVQAQPFAVTKPELRKQCAKFGFSSDLLVLAAQRDIENGRIGDGIEKCRCMIQMAKHLFQQSTMMHFNEGLFVELNALALVTELAMSDIPSDMNLQLIA